MARTREISKQRIQEGLHQVLADLLRLELRDERLQFVTITSVALDAALATAEVWVCAPAGKPNLQSKILASLDENSPLLRRELAARVRLRRIPALRFRWDPAPDHAAHMEDLIASLPDAHA